MTLPASGPLTISAVEAELQLTAGTTLDLNDIRVRNLANSNATGTQFSFSNLYGASKDIPPTPWTASTGLPPYTYAPNGKPYLVYNGALFNYMSSYYSSAYLTVGMSSSDGKTWTTGPNVNGTTMDYATYGSTTPVYSSTTGRYAWASTGIPNPAYPTQYNLKIWTATSPTGAWTVGYNGTAVTQTLNKPICSIGQGNYFIFFSTSGNSTSVNGSTDGGSTWTLATTISNAIPCEVRYYNGTFYLLTTATGAGLTHNLYSSTNGTTWTIVSNVYTTTVTCNSAAFDISSTGVFAAAFNDGYVRTSNDGVTWTSRTITGISSAGSNNSLLKLALCWAGPKYLLLACSYSTAAGIYLSRDTGATWSKPDSMPATYFATTTPNPLGTVVAINTSSMAVKYAIYK